MELTTVGFQGSVSRFLANKGYDLTATYLLKESYQVRSTFLWLNQGGIVYLGLPFVLMGTVARF